MLFVITLRIQVRNISTIMFTQIKLIKVGKYHIFFSIFFGVSKTKPFVQH